MNIDQIVNLKSLEEKKRQLTAKLARYLLNPNDNLHYYIEGNLLNLTQIDYEKDLIKDEEGYQAKKNTLQALIKEQEAIYSQCAHYCELKYYINLFGLYSETKQKLQNELDTYMKEETFIQNCFRQLNITDIEVAKILEVFEITISASKEISSSLLKKYQESLESYENLTRNIANKSLLMALLKTKISHQKRFMKIIDLKKQCDFYEERLSETEVSFQNLYQERK